MLVRVAEPPMEMINVWLYVVRPSHAGIQTLPQYPLHSSSSLLFYVFWGHWAYDIDHILLRQLWNLLYCVWNGWITWSVFTNCISTIGSIQYESQIQIFSYFRSGPWSDDPRSAKWTSYRIMRSMLATHAVHIQEQRIREAMIRVGVSLRWASSVHRWSYRVWCPNALWHIDGNHAN